MAAVLDGYAESRGDRDGDGDSRRSGFGWRALLPFLSRYRAEWRDILVASFLVQLLALAVPLCTQVIIDKVIAHRTMSTLIVIATAMFVIHAFTLVLGWLRSYVLLHTGNRMDAVLARDVLQHLLAVPVRYFEHRATGTLVARLQGLENIRAFVTGAAVTVVLDLPFVALFLILMLVYSPILTGIVLGFLVAMVASSLLVAPMMRSRVNEQFLAGARTQAFLTEFISGMETVKSLQMERQVSVRHAGLLGDYLRAAFRSRQLGNAYGQLAGFLEQMMSVAVMCAGAWLVMEGPDMTLGMLVAFQMFAGRVIGPVARLVGLWQEFQQVDIAVRRLADVMDVPQEPRAGDAHALSGPLTVELRDVGFRYENGLLPLFRNLNVKVAAGQCVVITGRSGSGKSTLVKLLQGFLADYEGQVFVAERDLRHSAADEIRCRLGIVPQETRLFSGSLRYNLTLGNPGVTDDDMVNACRLAEIHDVIMAMPKGYDTLVGENGVGLSGGQKQRVAIARALLRRTGALILDEPVSNIDAESTQALVATLNRFRGNVTVILVAHEPPDGLAFDQVVRIGEGGFASGGAK